VGALLPTTGRICSENIYCLNILADLAKVKNSNSRENQLIQGFISELKLSIFIRAEGLNYESFIQMYIKFEHKFTPDSGRLITMQQQHNTMANTLSTFLFLSSTLSYDTFCGSTFDYISSICTSTNPTKRTECARN
jgi:hypothetical protein